MRWTEFKRILQSRKNDTLLAFHRWSLSFLSQSKNYEILYFFHLTTSFHLGDLAILSFIGRPPQGEGNYIICPLYIQAVWGCALLKGKAERCNSSRLSENMNMVNSSLPPYPQDFTFSNITDASIKNLSQTPFLFSDNNSPLLSQ